MPCLVSHLDHPVVRLPDDICSAPDKQLAAGRLLQQAGRGPARLVVDLSPVRTVQGSLLGLLVRAHARLGARRGDIVLCVPEPLHREVFRVVALDRIFMLCPTLDEAVRAGQPDPEPDAVR